MLNQEERVADSVQTLVSRCNKMFKDAEEYDLVSLHNCVREVQSAIDVLTEEFNKESYDEHKVELLKQAVERNAIILEYYLQTVCSKYKNKYLERIYVEQTCQQVLGRSKLEAMNHDKEGMLRWASFSRSMLKMKRKSLHLNFELTKEERELLEDIVKELGDKNNE